MTAVKPLPHTLPPGLTFGLLAALEQRGAQAVIAALLAQVGAAIFWAAFGRRAEEPERSSLADRIRETAADLAANMQPAARAGDRSRVPS